MRRITAGRKADLSILMALACGHALAIESSIGSPDDGGLVYRERCAVCHDSGVDGAPVLGDTTSWAERAQQPEFILKQHLLQGYFLMPARAGDPDLSREELEAAIRYMTLEGGGAPE